MNSSKNTAKTKVLIPLLSQVHHEYEIDEKINSSKLNHEKNWINIDLDFFQDIDTLPFRGHPTQQ